MVNVGYEKEWLNNINWCGNNIVTSQTHNAILICYTGTK
jgi:hypothetical protein